MSTIGALSTYQQYQTISPFSETEKVSEVKKIGDKFSDDKFSAPSNEEIEDTAIISEQAKALYEAEESEKMTLKINDKENVETALTKKEETKEEQTEKVAQENKKTEKNIMNEAKEELTQSEKQQIAKLERTDAEVKAHEQAHMAAAGGLSTSGASYEYQTGPDGEKYAVAGEVSISYKDSSDPQQDIQNAEKLKAAAMAPADPSSTDKAVARSADARIAQAQKEIAEERQAQAEESSKEETSTAETPVTEKTTPETTSQKQEETPLSAPVNSAESIINPSAQAIVAGSLIK